MDVRLKTMAVTVALALAGVIAARAYTQATVNGSAVVAVVTAEEALLALSCSDGPVNADGACYIEGGQVYLDFSKGFEGARGFQPNSVYEFADLVIVRNNSAEDVNVSFATEGNLFTTEGLTVEVTMSPAAPGIVAGNGGTATISFKVTVGAEVDLSGLSGTLHLTATRSAAGE